MRKNFKRGLSAVMLSVVMLMSTACGNDGDGGQGNSAIVDENGNVINNNDEIKFSDFLVERCVRKQLNKDWSEKVTLGDVKNITSLVLDNTYDPTFATGINRNEGLEYSGYIDLVDLRYFTNLEELKIDAYNGVDTVVNVESIVNCKKLKKISIPCSQTHGSYLSLNRMGYKYWADIVAELPDLEYVDLGIYVDDHMKEVILSKASNKNITFYEGPEFGDKKEGVYKSSAGGYLLSTTRCYSVEASEYNAQWKYEYMGIGNAYKKYSSQLGGLEMFPCIMVENQEELSNELSKMDKNTEDIIIIMNTTEEVDFSVFNQFKNLVTLTISNEGFGLDKEEIWNEEYQVYEYIVHGMVGAKAVNLDKLASNKNLQVINLGGFVGELSDMSKIGNLREVSIIESQLSSVDFIGQLKDCKELILSIRGNYIENVADVDKKLDKAVSTLSGLKMYKDINVMSEETEYYSDIENMKSLETLFASGVRHNEKSLKNITDSDSIKNLYIDYRTQEAKIDGVLFGEMDSLENIVISGHDWDGLNYDNILKVPNLISAGLPVACGVESMGSIYTPENVKKIMAHGKISAFCTRIEKEYVHELYMNVDRDCILELYEAGIEDRVYRAWSYSNSEDGNPASIEEFVNQK